MNSRRLAEINTPSMTYKCSAEGSFEKSTDSPAPRELELKPGAMVIFCRNNPGVWINGTSGIVRGLSDDRIDVEIISSGKIVPVGREEWKSYKYEFKRMTGRIEEIETGSFRQFPLQLGYALTIHRAQGKTLDKAVIDMRHGTFAHGQLYVALSRTRRKSDMRIMGRICEEDMITDPAITEFLKG
jgi:ATP-dependent exoDNAse (exonuclease V) alpha subunit